MRIYFFLIVCLLSGCSQKQLPLVNTALVEREQQTADQLKASNYIVEIGDVECELCAHLAEQSIAAIPGVLSVTLEGQDSNDRALLKVTALTTADLTPAYLTEVLDNNGFEFYEIKQV